MRTTILALVLMLASNLAIAQEPGVYYCVTERMVGIQPERDAKEGEDLFDIPRSYGRVKPAKEKFIVKIQRIDETTRKQWCKGEPTTTTTVLYCSDLMEWEAILPDEKLALQSTLRPLVSHFGAVFTNNGTTTLMMTKRNYVLSRLQFRLIPGSIALVNYLEEGHCETFEE